jgi:hypothetical protein
MGARLFAPATGRFLSIGRVYGGNANANAYAYEATTRGRLGL